ILFKPRELTDKEFEITQRHTWIGARAISSVQTQMMRVAHSIVLSHHERWDGKGYPYGLCQQQIPLAARITSVADAYDAMTSDRVYRRAMPGHVALQKIREQSGRQFDP